MPIDLIDRQRLRLTYEQRATYSFACFAASDVLHAEMLRLQLLQGSPTTQVQTSTAYATLLPNPRALSFFRELWTLPSLPRLWNLLIRTTYTRRESEAAVLQSLSQCATHRSAMLFAARCAQFLEYRSVENYSTGVTFAGRDFSAHGTFAPIIFRWERPQFMLLLTHVRETGSFSSWLLERIEGTGIVNVANVSVSMDYNWHRVLGQAASRVWDESYNKRTSSAYTPHGNTISFNLIHSYPSTNMIWITIIIDCRSSLAEMQQSACITKHCSIV